MGAGCEGGGDAASFCQLQGYPRRTQRGTKESGDGDPREMTAILDRAPPPARTVNRADRVFNPFAARHHSFNLQCLNRIWKRSWQHCGALTQFRCNCPGEYWVGCSPEWGRGVKGGDAASFCQLQGYPRRTQRGTKESGDGDPREMTANLDRAPPPARTVNRADRVFNPFAARHHSYNFQCLNPIRKRAWQHFGALTQFRCNCPGGGGVQPGMGAGCEGGGDAASFCQLQGYPRRTQRGTKESGDGDPREMTAILDRAPPPARTVNRADRVFNPFAARHHSFNLQCLNRIWKRSWQHCGALTQFRCNCPGEYWVGCSPEWGRGVKGGDAASFCQLQGYPRRTQRGTKESGDGDPREMTANLDRALPPARTGNRADRVFNPFAARHHSFNLQCLNPIRKRSCQHFGALTQFRCNCPGENWLGCNPEWGRGVKGGRSGDKDGKQEGHWEIKNTN